MTRGEVGGLTNNTYSIDAVRRALEKPSFQVRQTKHFGKIKPESTCMQRTVKILVLALASVIWLVHGSGLAAAEIKAANTSSPRGTLRSFIDACNEVSDLIQRERVLDRHAPKHARVRARIMDCIDLREMPTFAREHQAAEAAVCIKEILDRVHLPKWEDIPDTEAIEKAGGFERLSVWRIPGTRITIARVEEGPQRHEYLFSLGTAARAKSYFERIRIEPYRTEGPPVSEGFYDWYVSVPGHTAVAAIVDRLPLWMQRNRTFGLANWKWPGVLLTLLFSIALMVVAYRSQWALTERLRTKNRPLYYLTIVFPIGATLVPLGAGHFVEDYLTVRGQPLYVLGFLANLAALLAAIVVIFSAANRIVASIIASPRINTEGLNAALVRISARLGSLVVALVLFIVGGQYLGIPVGTLLASAGILGAAVALGAQDVLKNLFGSVALFADKPFRVGDRITFQEYDGVVEDIGLRSTRLRLLSGQLASLPNEKLANNDVENVTNRAHIRKAATIHIPLNTPSEKVEKAVSIIRDNLANHEGMDPDRPPRVFFEEFGTSSFTIRFFCWYTPPNRWDFQAFSERLNLAILREFEEHGIHFLQNERAVPREGEQQ